MGGEDRAAVDRLDVAEAVGPGEIPPQPGPRLTEGRAIRHIEPRLNRVERRLRVGDIAVLVHVVHPGPGDLLQTIDCEPVRGADERRLDGIEERGDRVEVVIGDFDAVRAGIRRTARDHSRVSKPSAFRRGKLPGTE